MGEDDQGNELRSENSFSTLPMPSINNFKIEPIKDNATTTISISWESNVPISSSVFYKLSNGEKYTEISQADMTENHKIDISNLQDNSLYTVYAAGRDQFGNLAQSDQTAYNTPLDTRAPKISGVSIDCSNVGSDTREGESRAMISWNTDEPSSSQVEFGEGVGGNYYSNQTSPSGDLTQKHLVVVSGLKSGAPYHFRALSADKSGNTDKSGDYPSVAGESQKTILQLILNTLNNIFGWMSGWVK